MIIKHDPEEQGPFKLVEYDEMQELTAIGWVLVATIVEGYAESCCNMVSDKSPQAYPGSTTCETINIPATRTKFLLRQSYDEAVAELNRKLEVATETVKDLVKVENALKKVTEERDKVSNELERSRGCWQEDRREYIERLNTMHDKVRKYEKDLGRVREHFGTKAFEEAIKSGA